MPQIETKDGCIAYETHGSGAPVLIMRGLGRSVKHWLGYEHDLAQHCQVITLDLRGIGRSTRRAGWTLSMRDLAADVVAVLDDLKLQSAHILGVSLGGMVALGMGLYFPGRCRSLVTVNTSIGGQRTLRMSVGGIMTVASAVRGLGPEFHTRLTDILVGADCPPVRRAEIARMFTTIAKDEGMSVATTAKQLCAALRFVPTRQLRSMHVPTLVVYGTADRFVPHINSRKLVQHLPDATLLPIRGAGHEISSDKAAELTAAVVAWVGEHEARLA